MADAKSAVKKYWPYMLGGVVGLYLLSRFGGGGAAQPQPVYSQPVYVGGSSDAAIAAQAQRDIAIAQLSAQSAAENRAYEFESKKWAEAFALEQETVRANTELAANTLAMQTAANNQTYWTNYTAAQGNVAAGIAEAAGSVLNALNTPTVYAMQASSAENIAALESAAVAAAAGYTAQAGVAASSSGLLSTMPDIFKAVSDSEARIGTAMQQQQQQSGPISTGIGQAIGGVTLGMGNKRSLWGV